MNRYNIQISHNNENRTFTINSASKLADFVQKCLLIYDIPIDSIGGIYFFFVDANVYLNDCAENSLSLSMEQFYSEYGTEHNQFCIDTNFNDTTVQFREEYKNIFNNTNNAQTYFYRPEIHIVNNYYSHQSENPAAEPAASQSQHQEQPQPQEQSQPQNQNTSENQSRNNGYAFEFNYDYDPSRGQFFLNQQQTNSPFNDIMRTLGSSVLQSINQSRNQQNPLFGGARNNTYAAFFDTFQRAFTGETDRRVLRTPEIDRLSSGNYGDLKNNNYILSDCTQCTITLEEFNNNTRVIALPCKHAFKENAIRTWLQNCSNRCPTCRATVAEGVSRESNGFI